MLYKTVFLVIALECFVTTQAAKGSIYDLALKKLTCEINEPTILKKFDCDLRKVATSRFAIDFLVLLNRQLEQNTEARIVFQYKTPTGKKMVPIIDVTLKICDALSQVKLLPRLKELMNEAFRTSNFPYSCPLKGNFLYNMSNYIATEAAIPSFLGLIKFNFSLRYYENRKLIATGVLLGSTVSKSKSKLKS